VATIAGMEFDVHKQRSIRMATYQKLSQLIESVALRPTPTHCFAVPGYTMIDEINPRTGLSVIYGKSLEDVQRTHPEAQVMTIDDFCRSKAAAQDTAVQWIEVTDEQYEDALGCVPPAMFWSGGFLIGEPYDHHALTGEPRYTAFVRKVTRGDGWSERRSYQSSRPMTKREFREAKDKGIDVA
jgi:hypothetical protein